MFSIIFYQDKKGKQPIKEYIELLRGKQDKDSRIKFNKIILYIELLSNYGLTLKAPIIKHIEGEIWELRPLRDRIFFFCWQEKNFILLHHFVKKTQKTPKKEIEQAKRNLASFLERS